MFKRSKIEDELLKKREEIEKKISTIDQMVMKNYDYYLKARENELYAAHNEYVVLSNLQLEDINDENRDAYFMAKDMDLRGFITFRLALLERPPQVVQYEAELRQLVALWNEGIGPRCEHCGNVVEYGSFHESTGMNSFDPAMFFHMHRLCNTKFEYTNFMSAFCFKYDL